MVSKVKLLPIGMAALALAFVWAGLVGLRANAQQKAAPKAAGTEKAPAAVPAGAPQKTHTHKVGTADLTRMFLITGELRAARSRDITVPRVRSGFASTITFLVLEGTEVKKGDRILEFDAAALLNSKTEAERRLDETKLTISKTKATLESQRADLLVELSTTEGNLKVAQLYAKIEKALLPANTFQKYQLDLDKAVLARDKAKEKLANLDASVPAQMALVEVDRAQAELDLKKISSDIEMLQVDAPQDGIVVYGDNWASNRKVQIGDNLFPGMNVVSIPDMSSMQMVGFVYDTELRFLSPGMICDIHLDSVPGRSWRGRIESLTSVASRKSFASQHKVFRATVQPDSVDLSVMKPGMTARLEFEASLGSNALAIPRECLGLDQTGQYYVLKGQERGKATTQIVKVGRFSDRTVEIVSGLTNGDVILYLSREGSEVKS
jgi:HlyD family secretion protein